MIKKQILAILSILFFLLSLSACKNNRNRLVIDADGISTERDIMIYEAAKNTQQMEQTP